MNAIVLANTKDMSDSEWKELRNQGLGGSDVSAVLGINQFKGKLQLFMEKTGQWDTDDLSDVDAVHFGHKLEPIVAEEFQERTGLEVNEYPYMLQHPLYPWMLANIDREVICPKRGRGVLECKTTSAFNAGEWDTEHVPESYMVQVQHYLAVTGYDFAYIAVLIGGQKFDYWLIERDDELINMLIHAEKSFWIDHVQANNPPMPAYATDNAEVFDRLYPASEAVNNTLDLTGSRATELLNLLWANEQERKKLEAEEKAFKNELKDILKENEQGENDYARVTWKAPKPSFTVKTSDLKEKYPHIFEELKTEKKNSRRFAVKYKK
jgi:putative phage-type endonuclease